MVGFSLSDCNEGVTLDVAVVDGCVIFCCDGLDFDTPDFMCERDIEVFGVGIWIGGKVLVCGIGSALARNSSTVDVFSVGIQPSIAEVGRER